MLCATAFCRHFMNQDTDTVAAQDQTVRIFGSIALFLSCRHNHGGGVLCHICFSLSLQSAAKRFLFIPAGDSAHFLLCQVGDRGIGAFAGLLRCRDRMLVGAAADSSQVACSTGCRLRPAAADSCLCSGGGLYCICLLCAVTAGKVWQYWTLLIGIGGCLPLGLISYAELFPAFLSGLNQQPVRIVALVSPIAYVPFGVQGVFDFRYLLLAALLVGASASLPECSFIGALRRVRRADPVHTGGLRAGHHRGGAEPGVFAYAANLAGESVWRVCAAVWCRCGRDDLGVYLGVHPQGR